MSIIDKLFEEFIVGEEVILDKSFSNSSRVIVVKQSQPSRMFTVVKNPRTESQWEVMTNRLTKE